MQHQTWLQTEQHVQMPKTGRGREGGAKRSFSQANQPQESEKPGKEASCHKHKKEAVKSEKEITVEEAVDSKNTEEEKKAEAASKRGKKKVDVEKELRGLSLQI